MATAINRLRAPAPAGAPCLRSGGRMGLERVPTPMNYRRGFFRAWVMLSVLWVGGVAFVSGPDVYREFALEASIEKDLAATAGRYEILPEAQLVPVEHDPFPHPWRSLRRSTALAALPPLILLALGAMLGWVFSG